MRARSAPSHRAGAASPLWLEQSSDERNEPDDAGEHPHGRIGASPADDPEGSRRGGAFDDRFATGTGQFEMPPSRLALRGSPDDPISRIMTRRVVCARPEMDASFLRTRLLERGISGAPVVDDWGRVVGVVSKSDLVEHEVTSERGAKTVADIMMPLAFSLRPNAPIGQAAALMAYECVHRIVVVDDRGCVVGLVSALDIARWLGWCARYAVGREP